MKRQLKYNTMWHDRTLYFCSKIFFFIYLFISVFKRSVVCFVFSCFGSLLFGSRSFFCADLCACAYFFTFAVSFTHILCKSCIFLVWGGCMPQLNVPIWNRPFFVVFFFVYSFALRYCWYVLLCVLVCLYARVSREIYVCSWSAFKIDLYLNVSTW